MGGSILSKYFILLLTTDIILLDSSVQKKIYDEFYRLVYPMVIYMLKDHSATEEVIHEAFIRAIRNPPKIIEEDKLKVWLKTVTRNATYDYLRKYNRMRDELVSESVFNNEVLSLQGTDTAVDEQVEFKLMKEAIKQYIEALKPEYRQIIEMKWKKEMAYQEIAEELDVTVGTVRQRLYRAREAIKKRLAKEWGIEE